MTQKLLAISALALTAGVLAVPHAQATQVRSRTTAGSTTFDDTLVTGGGQPRATLVLNGSGATSDIIIATSGNYTNKLATTCQDNSVQSNQVTSSGTLFGDVTHLCFFGFEQPKRAESTINDL